MLKRFAGVPLLDKYDIYQRLMDYWAETMQDDMYLITSEGWIEAARPRPMINDKARKIKETPDLQIGPQRKRKKYKMDLLPPQLIVDRYFKEEEEEIQKLEANFVEITEKKNYFEEEHGGDEGALSGLEGSKGITKGNVQQRVMDLKETILKTYPVNSRECELAKTIKKTSFGSAPWEKGIKDSEGIFQEIDVLYDYLKLLEQEAVAKKAVREAKTALDKKFSPSTASLPRMKSRHWSLRISGWLPSRRPLMKRSGEWLIGWPSASRNWLNVMLIPCLNWSGRLRNMVPRSPST